MMCTNNLIDFSYNSHLFFSRTPKAFTRLRTSFICSSCSFLIVPVTRKSFTLQKPHWIISKILFILRWKYYGAETITNGKRWKRILERAVKKMVSIWGSCSKRTCQNPDFACSVESSGAYDDRQSVCLTEGRESFSRSMLFLSFGRSTHARTSPFSLGTPAIPEDKALGSSTLLIIPSFCKLPSSSSTFVIGAEGALRDVSTRLALHLCKDRIFIVLQFLLDPWRAQGSIQYIISPNYQTLSTGVV